MYIILDQDDLTNRVGKLEIKVINRTFKVYAITNNLDKEKIKEGGEEHYPWQKLLV